MAFWRDDHKVHWQGVHAKSLLSSAELVNPLSLLLAEFVDIFAVPSSLPPLRDCDHLIHLLPDSPPVAVRPYRYTQLLKDDIEAQCAAMLKLGIIRMSTSAFSSPVFLVRKRG
jgi:hypothetical protein